jgi:hypothetical protein
MKEFTEEYIGEVIDLYRAAYLESVLRGDKKSSTRKYAKQATEGLVPSEWWTRGVNTDFLGRIGSAASSAANEARRELRDTGDMESAAPVALPMNLPEPNGNGKKGAKSPTKKFLEYIEKGNWDVGDELVLGNLNWWSFYIGEEYSPGSWTHPVREKSGHAGYEWEVVDSGYKNCRIKFTAVPAKTVMVEIGVNEHKRVEEFLEWLRSNSK